MAVLMQMKNAHKSYGDQVLLDDAEATLTDDVKVGFVGPQRGRQKHAACASCWAKRSSSGAKSSATPSCGWAICGSTTRFSPARRALDFLMRDSGQPDWKCGEVAGQFELKGAYLEGPVAKLSGGWQTRVKLAALLLHEPNLLLLDEPTNFLDLRTQILLEHFLRNYNEACLIVSHDRAFLAATCTHTLDLTRGKLTMFPGKIDAFLENQARAAGTRRTAPTPLCWRSAAIWRNSSPRTRPGPAPPPGPARRASSLNSWRPMTSRATNRRPLSAPRSSSRGRGRHCVAASWPSAIPSEKSPAASTWKSITARGRRSWETTARAKPRFLRTIVDSLAPLAGEISWGYGCQVGVYAQHVYTSLPEQQTVMEYLEYHAAPGTKTQAILDLAGALLFRGDARRKADFRPFRRRTGPAVPGRAAARQGQRAGARRAGQPSRRRHGRSAWPRRSRPTRGR